MLPRRNGTSIWIRQASGRVIKRIPLRIAEELSELSPLIPFYHLVTSEKLPHVYCLYNYKNEKQFESDLDFLCKRYEPVGLREIIDHVSGVKTLKKRSFLLTFDDGYHQMYSVVAPILYKKGTPALFFLSTDFIDNKNLSIGNKASLLIDCLIRQKTAFSRIKNSLPGFSSLTVQEAHKKILSIRYRESQILDEIANVLEFDFNEYLMRAKPFLNTNQISKMIEMGFYFGAHSLDHPHYAELSLEDQLHQTIGSLQALKNRFQLPYSVFAFPHDDNAITKIFFKKITNYVDLTFGTAGPRIDSVTSNLQRIDFERTLEPAKTIVTYALVKKWIIQFIGNLVIPRA